VNLINEENLQPQKKAQQQNISIAGINYFYRMVLPQNNKPISKHDGYKMAIKRFNLGCTNYFYP